MKLKKKGSILELPLNILVQYILALAIFILGLVLLFKIVGKII